MSHPLPTATDRLAAVAAAGAPWLPDDICRDIAECAEERLSQSTPWSTEAIFSGLIQRRAHASLSVTERHRCCEAMAAAWRRGQATPPPETEPQPHSAGAAAELDDDPMPW